MKAPPPFGPIEPLLFERGASGRRAVRMGESDVPAVPAESLVPSFALAPSPPPLPELSEIEVVRHFTRLSRRNLSVDSAFYPLGSCTMKLNPKANERTATQPSFARAHPLQPARTVQGILEMLESLERFLAEITGLDAVTLEPAAGAHGEWTGLRTVFALYRERGESRSVVLVPDSAHGTNPSSCTICRFRAAPVRSRPNGRIDLDDLRARADSSVAALMVTNPNTLGLFESDIGSCAEILHKAGAQLYLDGANMNALAGIARPGDFGVDVMHLNLHKTFSTPHGGGGPGAGPVAVKSHLEPYLPRPRLLQGPAGLRWDWDRPRSIGKTRSFYGSFGVLVRAYAYIRTLGPDGLRGMAEDAILNANYLLSRVRKFLPVPHPDGCLHEFVATASDLKARTGVRALDVAKRLLDWGFHPPTIYFPLIVPEALMIEPTETETRETLDAFADALESIVEESARDPETLRLAPHLLSPSRPDEVKAAKDLKVTWGTDSCGPMKRVDNA
ncbi:MAG: aminomethyl-transferring glycine dehydrogenase subunit GcvPB [Planctomycetota bacterium]